MGKAENWGSTCRFGSLRAGAGAEDSKEEIWHVSKLIRLILIFLGSKAVGLFLPCQTCIQLSGFQGCGSTSLGFLSLALASSCSRDKSKAKSFPLAFAKLLASTGKVQHKSKEQKPG